MLISEMDEQMEEALEAQFLNPDNYDSTICWKLKSSCKSSTLTLAESADQFCAEFSLPF